MFNNTKYTNTYYKLINMAIQKNRIKTTNTYFESHHIIPQSLGGSNKKENLVLLTAREHFLVHWLLTKMLDNPEHKSKMCFAFFRLSHSSKFNSERILTPKQYEICKLYNSKARKNNKSSQETRNKTSKSVTKSWENADDRKRELSERTKIANTGVPKSEETKNKISKKLIGVKHPEWRNKNKSERQKKSYEVEKTTGEKFIITGLTDWLSTTSYNYKSILRLKKNIIDSYEDLKSIRQL